MSRVAESSRVGRRTALPALAPLFAWPDDAFTTHLANAGEQIAAQRCRDAVRALAKFAEAASGLDPAEREITYTSTFDLAPSCSPYLGVHVFGDDTHVRARLMTGLQSRYATGGLPRSGEMPDHVALVLAFAPQFDEDEWAEMAALILAPALASMKQALAATTNPYRHLIAAARALVSMDAAALHSGRRSENDMPGAPPAGSRRTQPTTAQGGNA